MGALLKGQVMVLLLLLAPLSIAAPLNVTFINPGFEDRGFWKAVTDTMRAAADQLGFELRVLYGDREWPKMVREAEAEIAAPTKPDFLILVNEHQQGARLLQLADQAGIPTLMLLNSLTDEQRSLHGDPREQLQHWLGSLTPDNEIAGYEMAQSLVVAAQQAQLDRDGEIALLTLAGDTRTPASLFRLEGLDRALAANPSLKEKRRLTVNWSFDEAYKRTRLWLDSGEPLEAVWAANDPIGLGAIKAIREVGLQPGVDVMVTGLNWSPDAIEQVNQGSMTLTHGGHFLAGAWAMVMLYDYAQGNDFATPAPQVRFPMTAIDATNAARYQAAVGDQQWSQVNFKHFSRSDAVHPGGYQFTLTKLLESVRR